MKNMQKNNKLLISIVDYGLARRAVKASKEAGATGGTTLLAKSLGNAEGTGFLGFPAENEREVLLTLASREQVDGIMDAIVSRVKMNKPGVGIAFVIDVDSVMGVYHERATLNGVKSDSGGEYMKADRESEYILIVTIVNKGDAEKVVAASKAGGATGGTILSGRGTGIHEYAKLFGISIEPEKEIILTLMNRSDADEVLKAIINEVDLDKPGKGIAFTLPVSSVAGISQLPGTSTEEAQE